MKRTARALVGLFAIAGGLAIAIWIRNHAQRTPTGAHADGPSVAVYIWPVIFVVVGCRWLFQALRPLKEREYDEELHVVIPLSDNDHGAEPERQRLLDFEASLEEAATEKQESSLEGNEFGGGSMTMFFNTDDARSLLRVLSPLIMKDDQARRGFAVICGKGRVEERVEYKRGGGGSEA